MVWAHCHLEKRRNFEQSIFCWGPTGLLKKLERRWKGRRLAAKSSLQRKEIGRVWYMGADTCIFFGMEKGGGGCYMTHDTMRICPFCWLNDVIFLQNVS